MKLLIKILLLLCCSGLICPELNAIAYPCSLVFPIEIDTTRCNQYDEAGLRSGVWLEKPTENNYVFSTYKEGKRNGILLYFIQTDEDNKQLFEISLYRNGLMSGPAMILNGRGGLACYVISMLKNPSEESSTDYPYMGYTYEFSEDGSIICEGWSLFNSDWTIDDRKIGIWKFYNNDGSFYEKEYDELHN